MKESLTIRSALAQDKDAVLAFCQNTFSWGDYIPELWDDWRRDPRGELLVAILGSQPVGLMHVQLLEDGAAWIEGVRVHPGFRRRGVASALSDAGRAFAIRKHSKVLRLATGMDNVASQSLFAGHGYARIAEYGEWLAEPARTDSALVHLAMEHDLASVTSLWRNVSYTHIIQDPLGIGKS